jgi:ABC-type multidrug transport system permease subunit
MGVIWERDLGIVHKLLASSTPRGALVLGKAISHANPLTYEVDALRALMLAHGTSNLGLGMDFAVLVAVTVTAVILGAQLYPNIVT